MLTGNKGEWSEIYALFKLISDGVLRKGDSGLCPADGEEYRILRLFKKDKDGESIYELDGAKVCISRKERSKINTRSAFEKKAKELLREIKRKRAKSEHEQGAFAVPSIETFMHDMLTCSIKAGSKNKTDLSVEILDHRTSQEDKRGFSIKSQLGGKSTLLNASGSNTAIRFDLECKSKEEVLKINEINTRFKIQDRVFALDQLRREKKIKIHRSGPVEECFLHNLTIIDDALPDIISSVLWNGYAHKTKRMCDVSSLVSEENPRNYPFDDLNVIYARKIKQLLVASALGMTAAHTWDGEYEATGGYIVVLKTGDVISYHFYDRAEFENYLFENTVIDSAASGRHSYATVMEEHGSLFFDLCLLIRFNHSHPKLKN